MGSTVIRRKVIRREKHSTEQLLHRLIPLSIDNVKSNSDGNNDVTAVSAPPASVLLQMGTDEFLTANGICAFDPYEVESSESRALRHNIYDLLKSDMEKMYSRKELYAKFSSPKEAVRKEIDCLLSYALINVSGGS